MKNIFVATKNFFLWVLLIMILPLLGACQKDGGINQEVTISLKDVPENSEYTNLPLIGTKWQLIGFANEKTGKVKKVKLSQALSYTLSFTDEREIWGYTSINTTKGKYELSDKEPNKITILTFAAITYAHEMDDSGKYVEEMNKVYRFDVTTQGLSLHYDSDNFLLFSPLIQ